MARGLPVGTLTLGPEPRGSEHFFDYREKYTTDQREHFRKAAERVKAGWSSFPRLVPECYPPEVFARGEALLAAAAKAAGDKAVAHARVEFLQS